MPKYLYTVFPKYLGKITYTKDGVFDLSNCTQKQLEKLYNAGFTQHVSKEIANEKTAPAKNKASGNQKPDAS